jgi:SpoVK/Ycf46/Vps4 family AAA+-type ATPase
MPSDLHVMGQILKSERLSADVRLSEIARLSKGYSGSDLFELCKAAANFSLRDVTAYQPAAASTASAASAASTSESAAAPAPAPAPASASNSSDVKSAAPSESSGSASAAAGGEFVSREKKVRWLTQAHLLEGIA